MVCSAEMDGKNKLYFGDNLKILPDHVADASVDLIYLDPPFNSNANYNVLFKEKSGDESAANAAGLRLICWSSPVSHTQSRLSADQRRNQNK